MWMPSSTVLHHELQQAGFKMKVHANSTATPKKVLVLIDGEAREGLVSTSLCGREHPYLEGDTIGSEISCEECLQLMKPEWAEEMPDETEEFIRLVESMRHSQKDYFRTRSNNKLQAAKKNEKKVDEWLTSYREPPGQKVLF